MPMQNASYLVRFSRFSTFTFKLKRLQCLCNLILLYIVFLKLYLEITPYEYEYDNPFIGWRMPKLNDKKNPR